MLKRLDADSWVPGRRASLEDVYPAVNDIIENVKANGDAALFEYAKKFDRCELDSLLVTEDEREDAYEDVDPKIVEYLIEAESRITEFHEYQKKEDLWLRQLHPGITLGIKTTPLNRAGCYIPGGRASYPSTAIMTVVPARVAGVESICACTPPPANSMTIAALDIAGATEIVRAGGAQAVAAMALGTESIEPVQKIVGPGNVYVTAAKILLRGNAEIDFPAGPSEICIIADESANPSFIAADILAQAEHDPNAACVLVTTSESLADKVSADVKMMAKSAPRAEIIEKALTNSGYIPAADLKDAVSISDRIAPEHLSIQVSDPLPVLSAVRNAGSIFVGPYTPVACGDYASGTNHVLPTAGYASVYSGLNVSHFCKTSTVQIIEQEGLEEIGDIVEALAEAEGLFAHSESVKIRRK
ncbi:histidinol dehydrogenase [Methanolacinia petrolearia DSM 11571]|uniref:Histidinol dehydrogenase n=1 Tax=Methanolacinia petrolearia (strain DSM 11571 / OCM 486 / SEBR 4847) TaxID=679926 RepID=E1RDV5_METP4|nr:histidinol dehydrogenase [Methanolacinia petrolearia]ADN37142.1 histidinol dehydrogenase [Methanolacinia petrolearia DSM 11571]